MMKKLLEKYPILMSSTGEGVALRVKAVSGTIVFVGGLLGLGLSSDAIAALAGQIGGAYESVKEIARSVEVIIGALGSLYSFYQFVRGWARAVEFKKLGLGKYASR